MSEIKDFVPLTSLLIAAERAIETERPNRLFEDPFARMLAGSEAFALLQPEQNIVTIEEGRPYIAVRTRFFDDFLMSLSSQFCQVIILGAGMDTRAFRLNWQSQTHIYEIDRPEVLDYKDSLMKDISAKSYRHTITANLTESWSDLLLEQGYNPRVSSIWLLEGLLMYLNKVEVDHLLKTISDLSAKGSWLGADLVNIKALEGNTKMKKHWRSGFDEPETLFAKHGWKASVVQPGDEVADFGRYTKKLPPREIPNVKRVFFVTAKKENN